MVEKINLLSNPTSQKEANFVMSEDEFLSLSPVCSHKTEKNVTHL